MPSPAGAVIWPLVHAERRALISDLEELGPQQWDAPSACPGWTIHDVVAHLIDNARTTPVRLVYAMARARFDFDRQNQLGVDAERQSTPAATLEHLRDVAPRTSGPPAPLASRLVEEIAHGEDIRRPLEIVRTYPAEAVEAAVRYQVRTPESFGGAKRLASAVTLRATDADMTLGTGPPVEGPLLELLMLTSGRPWRAEACSGPGLPLITKDQQ